MTKKHKEFEEKIKWMQDMCRSHTKDGECAYCKIPMNISIIKPKGWGTK